MPIDEKTNLMTGAQILLECLKKEGVNEVFGYPGGAILDLYDALYNCTDIKHYLVRHEQAAIHAAEGYSRASGKPGVAFVTSGPGACNAITGIANAYYDAYPIIVFTGQVSLNLIGNDAFQEADIVGITRSCCKHNYLVKDVRQLPHIVKEAFHIATTGKPGPVVVDLPKNILTSKAVFEWPEKIKLPGYNPTYDGHPKQISRALQLLCKAKKPVIISGGGVVHSNAQNELNELAAKLHIPITNTLMGIGTVSKDNHLALGMMGMHGEYAANLSVNDCDVLCAIGTRFSDRITGNIKKFAPEAQIIHIDIDPCSISKNVRVDIPIVGDAKSVINAMLKEFDEQQYDIRPDEKSKWLETVAERKKVSPALSADTGKLNPVTVIHKICDVTKEMDAIIATEVGQHQMWTAQVYDFTHPRQLITSGGLGTMGFGFPAAIGANVAQKDKVVIDIAGDGSIQMNIQELATCVDYNIPVIVAIINNGWLGMVRQWQERIYHEHYSQTQISSPDFVKLAEAYGALGFMVDKEEDIEKVLKKAIELRRPTLIDFRVEPFEMVYPWVLAGDPLSKVLVSNNCPIEKD